MYFWEGDHRDELPFSSHHISVCCGYMISTWLITVVSVTFITWLRQRLSGFSTAKLRCLTFDVKFHHDLCNRYLAPFLAAPFFEPFPIVRKALPCEFLLCCTTRLTRLSSLLAVRVRSGYCRNKGHYISRQWRRCHVDPTLVKTWQTGLAWEAAWNKFVYSKKKNP